MFQQLTLCENVQYVCVIIHSRACLQSFYKHLCGRLTNIDGMTIKRTKKIAKRKNSYKCRKAKSWQQDGGISHTEWQLENRRSCTLITSALVSWVLMTSYSRIKLCVQHQSQGDCLLKTPNDRTYCWNVSKQRCCGMEKCRIDQTRNRRLAAERL